MWDKILTVIQLLSAILLIVVILFQNREGGASGILGGEGVGGSFYTKRGFERVLLVMTIIFSFFFVGSAILTFLIK